MKEAKRDRYCSYNIDSSDKHNSGTAIVSDYETQEQRLKLPQACVCSVR